MRPITDAARMVRGQLPPGHGLELADLVSVGAEHAIRYKPTSAVLVFIGARHMMWKAARKWSGRSRIDSPAQRDAPVFVEYQEPFDGWRRRVGYDIETLIDVKRALLSMQLREAVSWYSHHWLCEELDHLESEFGVSEARIRQYCAAARAKLKAAWIGDSFVTEDDRAATKQAQCAERDARRAVAHEKMLAERRWRHAELQRLGASRVDARKGCRSHTQFAAVCRQLVPEAAE